MTFHELRYVIALLGADGLISGHDSLPVTYHALTWSGKDNLYLKGSGERL